MPGYFFAIFVAALFEGGPEFRPQVVDPSISIGYGLAIGDVDGDKKPDILLADKKQFVWYRNGDWKRFVMAENLTASDNVCIAARDIDGDGKVEVAVGAQWNPSETLDTLKSGAVFYLSRPKDPTQHWTATELHHEPTVHRMRWVKVSPTQYHLVVVPLHGRGNQNGEGEGVKILAYIPPAQHIENASQWKYAVIDRSMHLTHNLDVIPEAKNESIYVGGKEGIKSFNYTGLAWKAGPVILTDKGIGEVRRAKSPQGIMIATIEPMHGTIMSIYTPDGKTNALTQRSTMKGFNQGHALAVDDVLGRGDSQVVVGWREPNTYQQTGIMLYIPADSTFGSWHAVPKDKKLSMWRGIPIDYDIACEDLVVADLNGDGKKDIVAAGRATHNLKIYWNNSPEK